MKKLFHASIALLHMASEPHGAMFLKHKIITGVFNSRIRLESICLFNWLPVYCSEWDVRESILAQSTDYFFPENSLFTFEK